jgi:hypothetical protein
VRRAEEHDRDRHAAVRIEHRRRDLREARRFLGVDLGDELDVKVAAILPKVVDLLLKDPAS